MTCLDRFQAGRSDRLGPRRVLNRPWRTTALSLLACFALLQSGCQSGPFSTCGSCSGLFSPTGFMGRVQTRFQTRFMNRGNSGCCGSGAVTDGPVEYAAPAASGATVVPSVPGSSSVVTPGSSLSEPSILDPTDPTPRTKVIPPAGGNGSSSSGTTPKTSDRSRRFDSGTRVARNRLDNLPKTLVSTPEPTQRSAQADDDVLDHLPPLDLPGEAPRATILPQTPAAAGASAASAPSNPPAPPSAPSPAAAANPKPASAAPASTSASAAADPYAVAPPSVPPGIARFVAVDVKLAGGSTPSNAGLDWLVEKGYRTVLDLRDSSEVSPSFIAEVTNRGLRYVALPVGLKSLDKSHVNRFRDELALAAAQPVFFFDKDGTRAGALWYIRRVVQDRAGEDAARREAEELGLTDAGFWSAARGYAAAAAVSSASSAAIGA
jgi:protein tyrosine phosphatase (PTP) superfamily phosphohydrolase (DUF442 family)